jgi:hypothetical protein
LRRPGRPEEVGDLIAFCLAARGYLTGAPISARRRDRFLSGVRAEIGASAMRSRY